MRNALLACALVVALVFSAPAEPISRCRPTTVRSIAPADTSCPGSPTNARVACISTRHSTPPFTARSMRSRYSGVGRNRARASPIVATEQDEVYALDARSGAENLEARAWRACSAIRAPLRQYFATRRDGAPVLDEARATLYLDAAVMRANGPRHEISHCRSPTGRSNPAGRSMSQLRSAEVSSRHCRTSAARSRYSRARCSFRSAGTGAIAAPITGMSSAFPKASPAKSRAFRREREAAAYGRKAAISGDGKSLFAATGNTFPRNQLGRWRGCPAPRLPTLPAPSTLTTISPRWTGASRLSRPRPRRNRADPARYRERERRPEADPRHRQKRRRLSSRPR